MPYVNHGIKRRALVAVIGSADAPQILEKAAYDAGRQVIRAGFTLICGGLSGVMEAACRGAWEEIRAGGAPGPLDSPFAGYPAGRIIGVLPGTDKESANPYVEIAIPTGIGYARNTIIACACDALLAVGGGSGTLSEISMAWQYGKPIVVLEGLPGLSAVLAGKALDDRRSDVILGARDPKEAVAMIRSALEERGVV